MTARQRSPSSTSTAAPGARPASTTTNRAPADVLCRAIATSYTSLCGGPSPSATPAIRRSKRYDIPNEPIAPHHDVATLNPRLEPIHKEVTAPSREADPGRVESLAGAPCELELSTTRPGHRPLLDNLAHREYPVLGEHEARLDPAAPGTSPARYDVPMFLGETGELTDEWNARFRKPHESARHRLVRSGPTRISTRPRPWSPSRAPTAGTRSWPSPTARGRPSPTPTLIDARDRASISTVSAQERRGAVELLGVAGLEGISVTRHLAPPRPREGARRPRGPLQATG